MVILVGELFPAVFTTKNKAQEINTRISEFNPMLPNKQASEDKFMDLFEHEKELQIALQELQAAWEVQERETQKKIAGLEAQLEILENENAQMKESLFSRSKETEVALIDLGKEERLKDLEALIVKLNAELKVHTCETQRMRTQIQKHRAEADMHAERMKSEFEKSLALKDKEISELTWQLKTAKEKNLITKKTIEDLEDEVKDLTDNLSRLEFNTKNNESFQIHQLEHLHEELAGYRARTKEAEKVTTKQETLVTTLEADINHKAEAVRGLSEKYHKLEVELRKMGRQLAESEKKNVMLDEMNQSLEEPRKELRMKEVELAMFHNQMKQTDLVDVMQQQASMISDLEKSVALWQSRVQSQQVMIARLRAIFEEGERGSPRSSSKTPVSKDSLIVSIGHQTPMPPSKNMKLRERTNTQPSLDPMRSYSVIRTRGLVERERSARLEEQRESSERIAQLEKELVACKAELSVAQLMQLQSERKLRKISLSLQECGLAAIAAESDSEEENSPTPRRMFVPNESEKCINVSRSSLRTPPTIRKRSPSSLLQEAGNTINSGLRNRPPGKLILKKRS